MKLLICIMFTAFLLFSCGKAAKSQEEDKKQVEVVGKEKVVEKKASKPIVRAKIKPVKLISQKDISEKPLPEPSLNMKDAVANGNLEEIKKHVYHDLNAVHYFSHTNSTPITIAIKNDQIETLKLLLDLGANLSNSLAYAAYTGKVDMVDLLLARGAHIEVMLDNEETPPLIYAVKNQQLQVVEFLIKKGADVNTKSESLGAALDVAINNNNEKIQKILRDAGAKTKEEHMAKASKTNLKLKSVYDIRKEDELISYIKKHPELVKDRKHLKDYLNYILSIKNSKLLKEILKLKPDFELFKVEGLRALNKAIVNNEFGLVKLIAEAGVKPAKLYKPWSYSSKYEYPPIVSSADKNIEIGKYLLFHGANINNQDLYGNTFLHKCDTVEKAKWALSSGADINKRNIYGKTPVFTRALKTPKVAEFLIKNGADFTIADFKNATVLHSAANKGAIELVKLLIEKGANVNRLDEDGNSALAYAASIGNEELVDLLLSEGANADSSWNLYTAPLGMAQYNKDSKTTESITKKIVESGASLKKRDWNNKTIAFYAKDTKVLDYLYSKGVDFKRVANNRQSVITNISQYIDDTNIDLVKYFLDKGVDINHKATLHGSVLHQASWNNKKNALKLIRFLVKNGADLNLKNRSGKTPLDLAISVERTEKVKLLRELGAKSSK